MVKVRMCKDGKGILVGSCVGVGWYEEEKNRWSWSLGGVKCVKKGCL